MFKCPLALALAEGGDSRRGDNHLPLFIRRLGRAELAALATTEVADRAAWAKRGRTGRRSLVIIAALGLTAIRRSRVDATRRFADVTAAAVRVMLNAVAIVGKCEEKSKRPRDGRPTRRSKCLLRGRRRRHPKSIFWQRFLGTAMLSTRLSNRVFLKPKWRCSNRKIDRYSR